MWGSPANPAPRSSVPPTSSSVQTSSAAARQVCDCHFPLVLATLPEHSGDVVANLKKQSNFAGLHYFNPVALMPLVEIVRHDFMAPEMERRLAAFCRAIDKLPVPVAGTPGFLVNRILAPYMQEAIIAFSEGIPGPVIDKAALKFGMPMGPIELVDTVGLDVAASVGKIMADFHGQVLPEAFKVEPGKRG